MTLSERFASLTDQERLIYDDLWNEVPQKTTARQLDVSPRTVEYRIFTIKQKLGAKTLVDLIKLGCRYGWEADKAAA